MRQHPLMWAVFMLIFTFPILAFAEHSGEYQVGLMASIGGLNFAEEFNQYELFFNRRLDVDSLPPQGELRLNFTLGEIHSGPDTEYLTSIGPNLFWLIDYPRFWYDVGTRASVITKSRFSSKNLGKDFQFISHIGLKYNLHHNLSVGYRFQHMSNAGLSRVNPGLDLFVIWFTYNL